MAPRMFGTVGRQPSKVADQRNFVAIKRRLLIAHRDDAIRLHLLSNMHGVSGLLALTRRFRAGFAS